MDWLTDFFKRQAHEYVTFFIPKERVDIDYVDSPMHPGSVYCKLWMAEMRLAKNVDLGDIRYPVVHTSTSYFYGADQITVPYVADADFLKGLTSRNLDRVIARNYVLTPLFPYQKDTISVHAGLFSLIDSSILKTSIQVMGDLSSLLPMAPNFSNVFKMAEPLSNGIRKLLNIEDKRLELGYLQTFAQPGSGGSNGLRPGYFAAIRAKEGIVDKEVLCVVDDQLRVGARGKNKEFLNKHSAPVDYSYILFRIEAQKERDWYEVADVNSLVIKALESLDRPDEVRNALFPMIKGAVINSPDIVHEDRRVVIAKVKQELERPGWHGNSREEPLRSLHAIMQQPLPPPDPQLEAEIEQLERLFGVS